MLFKLVCCHTKSKVLVPFANAAYHLRFRGLVNHRGLDHPVALHILFEIFLKRRSSSSSRNAHKWSHVQLVLVVWCMVVRARTWKGLGTDWQTMYSIYSTTCTTLKVSDFQLGFLFSHWVMTAQSGNVTENQMLFFDRFLAYQVCGITLLSIILRSAKNQVGNLKLLSRQNKIK